MAVEPLFATSKANLIAALRLSGAVATDSLAVIDNAIQTVRIFFYQRLGSTRVADIVAMTPSENPSSDNEIMRQTAIVCEVAWVKAILLAELPTLFMDGSGNAQQLWNQEGLLRDASPATIADIISRLMDKINSLLGILSGDEEQTSSINVLTIGREGRNNVPGYGTGVFGTGNLRRYNPLDIDAQVGSDE